MIITFSTPDLSRPSSNSATELTHQADTDSTDDKGYGSADEEAYGFLPAKAIQSRSNLGTSGRLRGGGNLKRGVRGGSKGVEGQGQRDSFRMAVSWDNRDMDVNVVEDIQWIECRCEETPKREHVDRVKVR